MNIRAFQLTGHWTTLNIFYTTLWFIRCLVIIFLWLSDILDISQFYTDKYNICFINIWNVTYVICKVCVYIHITYMHVCVYIYKMCVCVSSKYGMIRTIPLENKWEYKNNFIISVSHLRSQQSFLILVQWSTYHYLTVFFIILLLFVSTTSYKIHESREFLLLLYLSAWISKRFYCLLSKLHTVPWGQGCYLNPTYLSPSNLEFHYGKFFTNRSQKLLQ